MGHVHASRAPRDKTAKTEGSTLGFGDFPVGGTDFSVFTNTCLRQGINCRITRQSASRQDLRLRSIMSESDLDDCRHVHTVTNKTNLGGDSGCVCVCVTVE